MGSLEMLLEGVDADSVNGSFVPALFPRQILSPSQIFVNHSKLPVRFIGMF
jgi:hypothetical protein